MFGSFAAVRRDPLRARSQRVRHAPLGYHAGTQGEKLYVSHYQCARVARHLGDGADLWPGESLQTNPGLRHGTHGPRSSVKRGKDPD